MDIENLVRDTTPDFMELEISAYIEEKGDEEREVVKVTGEHNGHTYGFEMTGHDDDVPDDILVGELNRFYSTMIETVIEEEL